MADSVIRSTMLFSNIFKVHFFKKKYYYAPFVQSQMPFLSEEECCGAVQVVLLWKRFVWKIFYSSVVFRIMCENGK